MKFFKNSNEKSKYHIEIIFKALKDERWKRIEISIILAVLAILIFLMFMIFFKIDDKKSRELMRAAFSIGGFLDEQYPEVNKFFSKKNKMK